MEILWTEICYNNKKILLGNIYRPPNSKVEWWSKFNDILNTIFETYTGHFILSGDFNCDFKSSNYKKLFDICST